MKKLREELSHRLLNGEIDLTIKIIREVPRIVTKKIIHKIFKITCNLPKC